MAPPMPSPRGKIMASTPSPRSNLNSPRGSLNSPRGNRRSQSTWKGAARYGTWLFILFTAYLSSLHLKYQSEDFDDLRLDNSNGFSFDVMSAGLPLTDGGAVVVSPFDPPPVDKSVQLKNARNSYSPSLHPILESTTFRPDSSKPLAVRFLTGSAKAITSETKFLVDGIERSKYLKLISVSFLGVPPTVDIMYTNEVSNTKAPVLWMVDFLSISRDCHSLELLVKHVKELDKASSDQRLILLDYSASWDNPSCPTVEELVSNIRIAKRGIIKDRHWDKDWVQVGTITPNLSSWTGGPALYMPHTVRQAFVDQIKHAHPYNLNRMNDVTHFWRKGDNSHYTFLRDAVSDVVASMQGKMVGTHKIRAVVKTFGDDEPMEINVVQSVYVKETLNTKIIVVAQRDEYEDHYRLMEALASGAMVMTDTMLGLPTGFQDRENIVVYDSIESLKELIIHYLNPTNKRQRQHVAKKGWELAMRKHRSWHRIEELLFGRPLSQSRHFSSYKAPQRRKRTNIAQKFQVDLNENVIFSIDQQNED